MSAAAAVWSWSSKGGYHIQGLTKSVRAVLLELLGETWATEETLARMAAGTDEKADRPDRTGAGAVRTLLAGPVKKEVIQLEKIKISKDEVAYVAHLARLAFGEEEMEKFTSQLNDILLYMDKLQRGRYDRRRADDPCHRPEERLPGGHGRRRPFPPEASLANAPEARGSCFQVPKVIE